MNIAVLGTRGIPANYGGFETCAEQLSQRWVSCGHEVLVYARKERYPERRASCNGAALRYTSSLHRFGLGTPSATLAAAFDLILRGRKYRWVHLYNTGNAFLLPLLRVLGFRVLISVDGIEWRREKWGPLQKLAHKYGARLAARFADRVVVDNDAVGDFYLRRFKCATTTIAYGAQPIRRRADDQETLSGFGLKPDGYCIFIGRIVPEKGLRELIDAYQQLKTDLVLVIVGDDVHTAYRKEIWARQSSRVRMVGYQYGRVCDQLLANARMYVSASRLEGTSPALLSAMSAEVCCLVNGMPENRSTAGNSVAFYEQDNVEDLVRTWQALLDDPERLATLASSGLAHQRRFYDWDAIARRYLQLFDEVERARSNTPEAAI
jgi:glycosyltransferase involved in cell wall biosynthesis